MNANILMGYRPPEIRPQEPRVNALARVLQLKSSLDQSDLAGMKMQEMRTGIERRNRLSSLLGQEYAKPEEREEALLRGGYIEEAAKLTKNRVDADKVRADTDKNRIDAAHRRVESWGSAMGFVRQNPTVENATAAVQHLVTLGVMPQEMAQSALAQVQQNPQAIAQWADMGFRAALSAKEQLPKLDVQNTGGQTLYTATDAVSGKPNVTASVQNTQSPDNAASNARMAADAAASRAVQVRGQDLADSRAREANTIAAQGGAVKTETDLRKEFADLPEVKRYKAAYPSYAAIEKAAKTNNPQADINLVYGLAKLYDPDSVVREGEYATIANSQAIPEWLKGMAQRVAGGGKLTTETKNQVLQQARDRIATFEHEYTKAQGTYEQIARQRGAAPERIFTPVGKPSGPKVGTVQDGYRYKGGDPADPSSWEKQ